MKKTSLFLTLATATTLLGGCCFPPPHHQSAAIRPAATQTYHHPVMIPAPRVAVAPAPRTFNYYS